MVRKQVPLKYGLLKDSLDDAQIAVDRRIQANLLKLRQLLEQGYDAVNRLIRQQAMRPRPPICPSRRTAIRQPDSPNDLLG